jgi:hypothetical protein
MCASFEEDIGRFSRFIIITPKKTVSDENLPYLYDLNIHQLPRTMRAKDPSKFLIKRVWRKKFTNLLHRITGHTSGLKGTEADVNQIRQMMLQEASFPKVVVFAKILEEIALNSGDDGVWRNAMFGLGERLYDHPEKITGTKSEILYISCLRNIQQKCQGKKEDFAREILGRVEKDGLISEMFGGAVFYDDSQLQKIICENLDISNNLALAALLAFRLSDHRFSTDLHQALVSGCETMGIVDGSKAVDAIISAECDPEKLKILQDTINTGLKAILQTRELPHPWFLRRPNKHGVPIPTLEQDGIQASAFKVVPKMPISLSFETAIDGWSQLVAPHYNISDKGRIMTNRNVGIQFWKIKKMLTDIIKTAGFLDEKQLAIFNMIFFAQPWDMPPEKFPFTTTPAELVELMPILARIMDNSEQIGSIKAPMPTRAGTVFLNGIIWQFDKTRNEDVATAASILLDRQAMAHEKMFGKGEGGIREKYREMLKVIAKRGGGQFQRHRQIIKLLK